MPISIDSMEKRDFYEEISIEKTEIENLLG
jgi:hypothetical protein